MASSGRGNAGGGKSAQAEPVHKPPYPHPVGSRQSAIAIGAEFSEPALILRESDAHVRVSWV